MLYPIFPCCLGYGSHDASCDCEDYEDELAMQEACQEAMFFAACDAIPVRAKNALGWVASR